MIALTFAPSPPPPRVQKEGVSALLAPSPIGLGEGPIAVTTPVESNDSPRQIRAGARADAANNELPLLSEKVPGGAEPSPQPWGDEKLVLTGVSGAPAQCGFCCASQTRRELLFPPL